MKTKRRASAGAPFRVDFFNPKCTNTKLIKMVIMVHLFCLQN